MTKNEPIGTVISTLEGPSPSLMSFVVHHEGKVHRGQFVEIDYSEGTLLALVNNLVKTNRYFERSESVKEFELQGRKLLEQFPVAEWEYLEAQTRPLGVFADGKISRPSFPPAPGDKVRIASDEMLRRFLKFDESSGLDLGEIQFHGVRVRPSLSRLVQKHLAILAMSGSGKSYFSSCLLEELLDRKPAQGRVAVVVLDVHGDYASFAERPTGGAVDYSTRTRLVRARDLRIGVSGLSPGMISSFIPKSSSQQERELARVILKLRQQMREGMGPYDLHDIKTELKADLDVNEKTSKALLGWLDSLDGMGLFSKTDSVAFSELVKPGILTVVDLNDVVDLRKKQIMVAYFASKLFHERRNGSVPPFLLVIEEAHQFIPEGKKSEQAISRSILETMAREGRKFGASLCLISQRPIQLSTTALSQCNTNVILRVTNPYDLDHIGKSCEGLDKRSLDMITSLQVGEGVMVGEAVGFPVFFKTRLRRSAQSTHEVTLEDMAKGFEESREQAQEDAKAFM
ncbi:MAG: ATP-binding protein [Candidatus Diapherotrites archaeon]|nr:ATP-binding protein [Candidatus Diapherotrites archaeon]